MIPRVKTFPLGAKIDLTVAEKRSGVCRLIHTDPETGDQWQIWVDEARFERAPAVHHTKWRIKLKQGEAFREVG